MLAAVNQSRPLVMAWNPLVEVCRLFESAGSATLTTMVSRITVKYPTQIATSGHGEGRLRNRLAVPSIVLSVSGAPTRPVLSRDASLSPEV